MAYNYDKLNGLIIEKYKTKGAFAMAMGLSERSLSLKLNNKVSFKQPEIDKAVELLSINPKNIVYYFLSNKFNNIVLFLSGLIGVKTSTQNNIMIRSGEA